MAAHVTSLHVSYLCMVVATLLIKPRPLLLGVGAKMGGLGVVVVDLRLL
jgi:hypothetical protein